MADQRNQVVVRIADASTLTQLAKVDSAGNQQFNLSQVGGANVPTPSAANVASAPVAARSNALYMTGTFNITTATSQSTSTLFNLAEAGNTVFDARSATVTLFLPTAASATLGLVQLVLSDTVGTAAPSITYTPLNPVSNQVVNTAVTWVFDLPFGVLKNVVLTLTFNSAPSISTLSYAICFRTSGLGAMQNSSSVAVSSGQSCIPQCNTSGEMLTATDLVRVGGTAFTTGQQNMAGSLPVVVANNQSNVPGNTVAWGGTTLSAGVALGTGASNPTAPQVGSCNELYNGSTWDPQQGSVEGVVAASALRSATTAFGDFINYNGRGLLLVVNVTVAGTSTLFPVVRGKDSISGSYYRLTLAASGTSWTQITGTGVFAYYLLAGNSATPVGADIFGAIYNPLPRTWNVNMVKGDSSNWTYSVSYVYLP